jgi:HK97 family phage portal protein
MATFREVIRAVFGGGWGGSWEPTERGSWNDGGSTWFQPSGSSPWITETSAFNLSAVWACETLIADNISTLPVDTYRKKGETRAETTPPFWLEQPNPEFDRVDYDTQRLFSLLGWGDSFSLLVRGYGTSDPLDSVVERWAIDPNSVEIGRDERRKLAYSVDGERIPTGNIQHIRGYTLPGCVEGMSVVAHARASLGLSQSAENYGSRLMENGIAPSGALKVPALPAEASKEVVDRLRDSFAERYAGSGNAGKPVVLTGGTEWQQLTLNPVDAQFLETRKFQKEEICSWFRVPPHKIQIISGNASQGGGNGLEQMDIAYANDTLRSWTVRLERADTKLLPRGQYVRYNTDAYVRTDLAGQTAYFTAGRLGGWLSANDVRRLKDEKPIDNGDVYLQPLNMIEAGTTPEVPSNGFQGEAE